MSDNNTYGEGVPLHTRTIGTVSSRCGGELIVVEHVFAPDGAFACEDCGGPGHDPGMVGLTMSGDGDQFAGTLLSAEEALVLANRLTRAASLILESEEEPPDIEREAARFSVPDDTSGAQPTFW